MEMGLNTLTDFGKARQPVTTAENKKEKENAEKNKQLS